MSKPNTIHSLAQRNRLLPNVVDSLEPNFKAIDAKNKNLNALRVVNRDGTRSEAKKLSSLPDCAKSGKRLFGVPFSLKDHIDLQGLPRSEGTKRGETDSCTQSAFIAKRLLKEGALCIGKGNMAEYGRSFETDNKDFGQTRNPFDPTRTSGGSGGGEAVAVATGMAQFGIGMDSGGSVRIPANFCGLFGMHTTPGVISTGGMTSFTHTTRTLFRNPGIMARNLSDTEIVARILVTHNSNDPDSIPFPIDKKSSHALPSLLKNKKFAWFSSINGVSCDKQIAKELQSAVQRLEGLGLTGIELCPDPFGLAYEPFIILAGQAALLIDDRLAERRGTPHDPALESPSMKTLRHRIATELPPLSAETLTDCWQAVSQLRQATIEMFSQIDFVLAPVAACLPSPHGTSNFSVDGQDLQSQEVFQFSSSVNVLGLPAIAFPTGMSDQGLPLGLQVVGPRFSEFQLCSLLKQSGFTSSLPTP